MPMSQPIPHSRPWITDEDRFAVDQTLLSCQIAHGNLTAQFCQSLKETIGHTGQSFMFQSGTQALSVAIGMLIGNVSDAEVICPTYVCHNVLTAIRDAGGSPVLCDIDQNWVASDKTVQEKISSKTKAIIATHTFGYTCNLNSISENDLKIIEDSCQSLNFADDPDSKDRPRNAVVHSFHATKLITTGTGGMLSLSQGTIDCLSNNERSLLFNTQSDLYQFSDLQAALGLSQIKRYQQFVDKRQKIATKFRQEISLQHSMFPTSFPSVPFRFPIWSEVPFEVAQKRFLNKGIHVRRGVDALLHRHLKLSDEDFPNAVDHFNHTISIPFYPSLSEVEIDTIIAAVNEIL